VKRERARRFGRVLLTAGMLGLLVGPTLVNAHDLGLSRAVVSFENDRRCTIDILVDPQALLAQVTIAAGQRPAAWDDPSTAAARITAQLPLILEGIEVRFDDRRAALRAEFLPVVASSLIVGQQRFASGDARTLRLTGQVPADARTFSFAYRWTYGATALVVRDARSSEPRTLWLGAGERSPEIALGDLVTPGVFEIARQYLALGFVHILPRGIDHILFVLGLFFLSARWQVLLLQVSTFTLAHTLTLGLTMLGVVSLRPSIVEPLIALSIAYVALENLTTRELRASRLILIFSFGLLHGMGFAGVLKDLGFPAARFLPALLSFNVGVECGQLSVLAAATLALSGLRWREASLRPLVTTPASILIAISGLYWTVERVFR